MEMKQLGAFGYITNIVMRANKLERKNVPVIVNHIHVVDLNKVVLDRKKFLLKYVAEFNIEMGHDITFQLNF